LAVLNQNAGKQALRRLDAAKARQFAQAGLMWLGGADDPWTVDGHLAQDLALLPLRTVYFLGQQTEVAQLAEHLLARTRDPATMADIYVILMMEATACEDYAAVDAFLHRGLAALQIKFPRRAGRGFLLWHFLRCRWLLRQRNGSPDQFVQQWAQRSDEHGRYAVATRVVRSCSPAAPMCMPNCWGRKMAHALFSGRRVSPSETSKAADTTREASYHPLIRLYALLSDGAAARRAYAACLAMLHEEHGAPPSAQTELIAAQYLTA